MIDIHQTIKRWALLSSRLLKVSLSLSPSDTVGIAHQEQARQSQRHYHLGFTPFQRPAGQLIELATSDKRLYGG